MNAEQQTLSVNIDMNAWEKYPNHHWAFNKLTIAEMCGYTCGVRGIPVPRDGRYVIRPVYNLHGMSAEAVVKDLIKGDTTSTPYGYFWCEYFEGSHISVDYWAKDGFKQGLTVLGSKEKDSLYKFKLWTKYGVADYPLEKWFDKNLFVGVDVINIEYVGDRPIEVHLRSNPDYENHDCDYLEVIWQSDVEDNPHWRRDYENNECKWIWIESRDETSNGDVRLGFMGLKLKR